MYVTGETLYKVRKSLDRLEDMGIIGRDTKCVSGNGRANKGRIIYLKKNYRNAIFKNSTCNVENDACYVDNRHIKDNLKDKENINLGEHSSPRERCNQAIRYY